MIVRQAAVALGDDRIAGPRGAHQAEHALDQLRRAGAAIGAERRRPDREIVAKAHRRLAGQAHHGAAAGIEGHGGDDRQAGLRRARDRSRELLGRRDRLDPKEIDAALGERCGLLGEHGLALGRLEAPDGRKNLAGRADVAGDQHRASRRLACLAGKPRGRPVQLGDACLGAVQRKPHAIGAKAVGQQQIAAGVDEALVDRAHLVRPLEVPKLRRAAALEAAREQAGAHRAVGQQHALGGEQAGERIHRG